MPIQQEITDQLRPLKIWASGLDPLSERQLRNVASLPIIHHHVVAMPDAHGGIGATVGSVLATRSAIIPAAMGVDIGCGMIAARLSLTANDTDEASLRRVFGQISRDVPVGRAQHREDRVRLEAVRLFEPGLNRLTEKHPQLLRAFGQFSNWMFQIGTLGSGNHFIEVCLDEDQRVWVMLHSGSRGIGNAIGNYFIALAREDMLLDAQLPDRDLAYFEEGGGHFDDYVEAVSWRNREEMLGLVLAALRRDLPAFNVTDEVVNCHHNYVAREHHYGADVCG